MRAGPQKPGAEQGEDSGTFWNPGSYSSPSELGARPPGRSPHPRPYTRRTQTFPRPGSLWRAGGSENRLPPRPLLHGLPQRPQPPGPAPSPGCTGRPTSRGGLRQRSLGATVQGRQSRGHPPAPQPPSSSWFPEGPLPQHQRPKRRWGQSCLRAEMLRLRAQTHTRGQGPPTPLPAPGPRSGAGSLEATCKASERWRRPNMARLGAREVSPGEAPGGPGTRGVTQTRQLTVLGRGGSRVWPQTPSPPPSAPRCFPEAAGLRPSAAPAMTAVHAERGPSS